MYLYFLWPIPFWSRLWHVQRDRTVKQSTSWPWHPCVYRHTTRTEKLPIWQHQVFTDLLTTTCWGRAMTLSTCDCPHLRLWHLDSGLFCVFALPAWSCGCLSLHPPISSNPTYNSFSNNPYLIPILTIPLIFSCLWFPGLSHLLKHVCPITNVLICAALYSLLRFRFLNLECYNSYTSFYLYKD